jgi:hypothetical protein
MHVMIGGDGRIILARRVDSHAFKEKQITESVIPIIGGRIGDARYVAGGIPLEISNILPTAHWFQGILIATMVRVLNNLITRLEMGLIAKFFH